MQEINLFKGYGSLYPLTDVRYQGKPKKVDVVYKNGIVITYYQVTKIVLETTPYVAPYCDIVLYQEDHHKSIEQSKNVNKCIIIK